MKITEIHDYDERIVKYLSKRRILPQYNNAKQKIILWVSRDLKLREPKSQKIYYFRINKQFRAYGILKWNILIVFKIDNHQNG